MILASSHKNAATALIALGANLPFRGRSPAETVRAAMARLTELGDAPVMSGLWRSVAWPDGNAPSYVNAVMRLQTSMNPYRLLQRLLDLEVEHGRVRTARWASRTLDLDLIDLGAQVCGGDGDPLQLPHPRAAARAFVLAPLRDVAPLWRSPATGESAARLWARLPAEARGAVARLTPRQAVGETFNCV